ncbi:DUF4199 domain-containing protein [Capnocytophaga canimorsus]|uniref:DUF4199 domain-containing protein n=1 Tax=Capnocytophaga canimorsus TaxID=28188 RepID=UPI0015629448|nr:DUF4199 domain-containing protein [Capnocytophaga canimorsus]GJQ04942.1 hypothetical protein CAPN009_13570 [Capnocytophaga canimorsus]
METKVDAKSIMLKFGGLLGLGMVILQVIPYLTGEVYNPGSVLTLLTGFLGYGVIIACIVFAMLAFRKQNEGFMAFGEGLKVGMGVAVIGGLIVAVYTFIFMNYIEPDFAQKILEIEMQKALEANPQMTQEQMDMAQKISSKFAQTWIITAISFVGSLFFGFIVSLVASAVLQKKRPDTF